MLHWYLWPYRGWDRWDHPKGFTNASPLVHTHLKSPSPEVTLPEHRLILRLSMVSVSQSTSASSSACIYQVHPFILQRQLCFTAGTYQINTLQLSCLCAFLHQIIRDRVHQRKPGLKIKCHFRHEFKLSCQSSVILLIWCGLSSAGTQTTYNFPEEITGYKRPQVISANDTIICSPCHSQNHIHLHMWMS